MGIEMYHARHAVPAVCGHRRPDHGDDSLRSRAILKRESAKGNDSKRLCLFIARVSNEDTRSP
jgi:hypothetical protein